MTTANRQLKGWKGRLSMLILEKSNVPFQWGENDCVSFASDAVMAMTNEDPFAWGRGTYKNKHEALGIFKTHYGVGLLKTFTMIFDEMGAEEVEAMDCGVIGFVQLENVDPEAAELFGGITMVVGFNRKGEVLVPSEKGLMLVSKYKLVRAWRL